MSLGADEQGVPLLLKVAFFSRFQRQLHLSATFPNADTSHSCELAPLNHLCQVRVAVEGR